MEFFMPKMITVRFNNLVEKYIDEGYTIEEAQQTAINIMRFLEPSEQNDFDTKTNKYEEEGYSTLEARQKAIKQLSNINEIERYINLYIYMYLQIEKKVKNMAIKLGYIEGSSEYEEWVSENTYNRVKKQIAFEWAKLNKKTSKSPGIKIQSDLTSQKNAFLAT